MSDLVVVVDGGDTIIVVDGGDTIIIEPPEQSAAPPTVVSAGGPKGDPGASGAVGPPGPPGSSGGWYRHDQVNPALAWLVQHGLGFIPGGVHVTDVEGYDVEPVVSHQNANTVILTFHESTAGTANLS